MKRAIALILVLITLLSLAACGGSKKSYAEQYGYSVEDFYYKGSDGKWYSR